LALGHNLGRKGISTLDIAEEAIAINFTSFPFQVDSL